MAPKTTSDDGWHEEARALRFHNTVRRKWLSCISVFAVICVSVLLLMYSLRWTATPCQSHSKHVELVSFAKVGGAEDARLTLLAESALSRVGLYMSPPTNTSLDLIPTEEHVFLDTPTKQLRENSLELKYSKRLNSKKGYPNEYTLQYISQDLCLDRPSFPLDAEFNVDEETSVKSTKTISDTDTTFYFFQSTVRSRQSDKMKGVEDLALTFPGARGLIMTGSLVASETCAVSAKRTARLYFSKTGVPLPSMTVKFEGWQCCEQGTGACRAFDSIRVVYKTLEEEVLATRLYHDVRSSLETDRLLCGSAACGVPLYQA